MTESTWRQYGEFLWLIFSFQNLWFSCFDEFDFMLLYTAFCSLTYILIIAFIQCIGIIFNYILYSAWHQCFIKVFNIYLGIIPSFIGFSCYWSANYYHMGHIFLFPWICTRGMPNRMLFLQSEMPLPPPPQFVTEEFTQRLRKIWYTWLLWRDPCKQTIIICIFLTKWSMIISGCTRKL